MEQTAPLGYRDAVEEFKRRLIEAALRQSGGNRSRAARSLGLQRTYLLRLIRDLGVAAPPAALAGLSPEPGPGDGLPREPAHVRGFRVDTPRTQGVK